MPQAPNNGGGEFIPTDAAGVDWVLGKMADARARASRIRENAERMARAEERDAEFLEWRYGAALQAYVRAELEGGKKRSVRPLSRPAWVPHEAGGRVPDEPRRRACLGQRASARRRPPRSWTRRRWPRSC